MNVGNHNEWLIPTLPNEITSLICENFDQNTKIKCAKVSKSWHAFIFSPVFWKKVILYDASKFGTEMFECLKLVEELDARASNLTDTFIKKLVTGPAGKTLKSKNILIDIYFFFFFFFFKKKRT